MSNLYDESPPKGPLPAVLAEATLDGTAWRIVQTSIDGDHVLERKVHDAMGEPTWSPVIDERTGTLRVLPAMLAMVRATPE